MKKLLAICLVGTVLSGFAQKNESSTLDQLIKSKKFAIVVSEVSNKKSNENPNNNIAIGNHLIDFPNLVSPSQSRAITSIPFTDNRIYIMDSYYVNVVDKTPLNTSNLVTDRTKPSIFSTIFLVQSSDLLMLKPEHGTSVVSMAQEPFKNNDSADYNLKSKPNKDGSWVLVYSMKSGKDDRKVYVNIAPDGSLKIQDNPTGKGVTLLKGYVTNVIDERI